MDEMIKDYLVDLLGMVKSGASFLVGQLPAFAHEIIVWGIASNIISVVLAWILVVVFILVMNSSKKIVNAHDKDDYGEYAAWWVWAFSCFFVAIAGVVAFIMTCTATLDVFKAIYAPRLYLIEQLGSMISAAK